MLTRIKIAKFLMNLMPARPEINSNDFKQEYFRHPRYKLLNEEEKKKQMIEFVNKNILKADRKPSINFFQIFPSIIY